MNIKVVSLYEFDGAMELGKWYDSFIYCPSQCFRHVVVDGVHYILYLRWRYSAFWHAYIIQGATDERSMQDGQWTDDLFLLNCLEYGHDDVELAKPVLLDMFERMYVKGYKEY